MDERVVSGEQAGASAPQGITTSHVLGEVVWLLSQSATHRHFTVGDLEWLVMPPILLEQFRIFRGESTPVGLALWADLSEQAEGRLNQAAMTGQAARLRPDEWKSGDRLWLVDLITLDANTDSRLQQAMFADLIQNVFPGRSFKMHVTDPLTGDRKVQEIGG